jgi:hypothetical protein
MTPSTARGIVSFIAAGAALLCWVALWVPMPVLVSTSLLAASVILAVFAATTLLQYWLNQGAMLPPPWRRRLRRAQKTLGALSWVIGLVLLVAIGGLLWSGSTQAALLLTVALMVLSFMRTVVGWHLTQWSKEPHP